jgi:hypothetical protein
MELTQEDFEELKSMVPQWEGVKSSGTLNISHTQKLIVDKVHLKLVGQTFCKHCPEAVYAAFCTVFREYDRFITKAPAEREKRKRI